MFAWCVIAFVAFAHVRFCRCRRCWPDTLRLSATAYAFAFAGFQKIVDRNERGMLREYCKHRVKMWSGIVNIIDRYPDTDRALYIESSIVDPRWRGKSISKKLHKESLKIAGHKELVIFEGMMPKHFWGISRTTTVNHLKMGFELELVDVTYDDYACPLYFRPPL